MEITIARAQYLAAATGRIHEDPKSVRDWMTDFCTECNREIDIHDTEHLYFLLPDSTIPIVLIGCEGYLFINPKAIDLGDVFPNWQDWTAEIEEVRS